jgi:hypothetical protein
MRRPLLLLALAILGSLLAVAPAADAALDPTDTATGTGALTNENGGHLNTADGYRALNSNTTGYSNTAVGAFALPFNTNSYNTAAGSEALFGNTTGTANTAVGFNALGQNTTGNDNTALGLSAGATDDGVNRTGSDNTFLGFNAGPGTPTQLTNATAVGANALVSEDNAVVLGGYPPQRGTPPVIRVGIGTQKPQSRLQVGDGVQTAYNAGAYLQVPVVDNTSPPPSSDCSSLAFIGRLVLQYNPTKKVQMTLWVCAPKGVWRKLAEG